jgi:hypothetical protein
MSIRCGKCQGRHETIHDVRECYGIPDLPASVAEPASPAQRKAVNAILGQQGYSGPMSAGQARAVFSRAESEPSSRYPVKIDAPMPVPEGYYATPSATGNNDYDFWQVQHGQKKWEGYVFVKRVLGGHDPQHISRIMQNQALKAITDFGVDKAALMYGTELGRCSSCNRTLTDETSRLLGKGPDCRARASGS